MFRTLSTLSKAFSFNAEEKLKDQYSIDLINQKIREAEANLKMAKTTLATLIIRHRNEKTAVERIVSKIKDLEKRAQAALTASNQSAANLAASAIADLENELTIREKTVASIGERISQIRSSIEKAHHRLTSLKQGAVAAKAITQEQKAQRRVADAIGPSTSFKEAEELINRIVGQDDPFEESEVLEEIENDLSNDNAADTLANQGFGPATKSTSDDVLARLNAKIKK